MEALEGSTFIRSKINGKAAPATMLDWGFEDDGDGGKYWVVVMGGGGDCWVVMVGVGS